MTAEPHVSVTVAIRCTPHEAWLAIADPRTMATFSPELRSVAVSAPPPLSVGDSFTGSNRRGRRSWSTACRVVESVADVAFAYDVTYLGLAVARWRYAVSAQGDGSVVEEQWWDRRGRRMRVLSEWGTGVHDRAAHNRTTMTATLERLRACLEGIE